MMPWFFRLSHTPSAAFRGFRGPKLPGRGRAAVGHASSHDPPTHGPGVTAGAKWGEKWWETIGKPWENGG